MRSWAAAAEHRSLLATQRRSSSAPAGIPRAEEHGSANDRILARSAPRRALALALAAARENRCLVRVACGAPRDDLVERAAAAHADVAVVEAAVAHARRGERIVRRRVHASR